MEGIKELIARRKQKKSEEKWLIKVHFALMKEFGWIPFEEFKKLPLTTVMGLLDEIKEYRKNPEFVHVIIEGIRKKGRR